MKDCGGIRLRPATNADAAAVKSLVFTILREYGLTPAPETTDADLDDIERSYFGEGGWFEVLEGSDGSIIGTYGLEPAGNRVCELRKMYLDRSQRGKGLGRMLLEDAIERARRLDFETMVLETAVVLKEAVSLYVSCGFTEYMPESRCPRSDRAYRLNLKQ